MLGFSRDHSAMIVSAPSNIACDDIEERISGMADTIISKASQSKIRLPNVMSVRGYAIDKEAAKLLSLLGRAIKGSDELDPSPWKFRHSLCCWTARAIGFQWEGLNCLTEIITRKIC